MKSRAVKPKPSLFVIKGGDLSLSNVVVTVLLRAVLAKGASFRFRSKGFSMAPFIKDGDIITLSPLPGDFPGFGDVVALSHPQTERLAVHRVIQKRGESYSIKGDNLPEADGLIRKKDILGRVTKVERGGRKILIGLGPEKFIIAFLTRTGLLLRLLLPLRRAYAAVFLTGLRNE